VRLSFGKRISRGAVPALASPIRRVAYHPRSVSYRLHKLRCNIKADTFWIKPRRRDRAPHGRLIEPGRVSNTSNSSSHS
jgi:hypothetical protein